MNMVYHINWFSDVKLSSHSSDKSYLVFLYNPYNPFSIAVLTLLVYFWWFLHIYLQWILVHSLLFLVFLVMSLVFVSKNSLKEWVEKCSIIFYFLEEFVKLILIPVWMLSGIHQWSNLGLAFSLLELLKLLIWPICYRSVQIFFLLESVSVICIFLEICPFI